VPETEKTDPLFFMEGILRNSSEGNIDETSQEDGEEGGKYVMAGDPYFGESQGNYINLNHDEKGKGNEEKKDHEENSEGAKKHRAPPYFRLSLPKRCIKIFKGITPTLPSPPRGRVGGEQFTGSEILGLPFKLLFSCSGP
jgi:hypothetical protein